MDAVEFLKEKDRMCRATCIVGGFMGRGDKCEIERQRERGQTCGGYMINHPEEAVEIVERWAKEHPRKTRQSEFLKMFPNAQIFKGVLKIQPCELNDSKLDSEECHSYDEFGLSGCYKCRKKYWLEEVE